jgi:hypothetical protein
MTDLIIIYKIREKECIYILTADFKNVYAPFL